MRINCAFGQGGDTILFSTGENRFYVYGNRRDNTDLHGLYGGKQYYTSRSGMSGAGFLEPPAGHDLVEFGFYRTDIGSHQAVGKEVFAVEKDGIVAPVVGYAPMNYHSKELDSEMPVVMVESDRECQEQRVAFAKTHTVPTVLQQWVGLDWQEKKFPFYLQGQGEGNFFSFYLANPERMRGVDARRFLDLTSIKPNREEIRCTGSNPSLLERTLGIMAYDGEWLHYHPALGIFDDRWETDPRTIEGEIIYGWAGDGKGVFWRRRGTMVDAAMEVETEKMGRRYAIPGLPPFVDFEITMPAISWFADVKGNKENLAAGCLRKARLNWVYSQHSQMSPEETFRLLEQHADGRLTVQDSLDAGNCKPGTLQFAGTYGIQPDNEDGVNVHTLLEYARFPEMLQNSDFRRTVWMKFGDVPATPA